jgi:hypothetical protein
MKKITVFILVLGLNVPVQAWHLFPVREKIVKEKETNWLVIGIVGLAGLVLSFVTYKIGTYKLCSETGFFDGKAEGQIYELNRINNFLYDYDLRVTTPRYGEYALEALIRAHGIRVTDTIRLDFVTVKSLVAQTVKPPVPVLQED